MAFFHVGDVVNANDTNDLVDETQIVDDLTVVPLDKDSFAICELCGRVGRRGQFYPRNNKFCSLRCHASNSRKRHCSWRYKLMEGAEHMAGLIPLEPLPQLQQWQASYDELGPIKQVTSLIANSYEWKDELFGCDFLAAPVSLFKHAPLHEMWDATFEGMKVEVRNTDCEGYSDSKLSDYFWVAAVLKVKGYMGLLRYEGFGSDESKDFWVNLCCSEVHPVGWCATRGKPLIPPRSIEDKYTDWKKFLVKQLTGARTLPANFYTKLNESLVSRFSVGIIMEVVDKNRISQVKAATISEIIGKRLHVKYYDSSPEDNGFWCHEDSPLIHPVGWAFRIGHPLDAPQSYCHRVAAGRLLPHDSMPDMFYKYPNNEPPLFSEGLKLEAIDPLNLAAVCAATVMQILNDGYMMIRIDCYPADASGADWFCYHQRSPCIFPVGFAMTNNIPLIPPSGFSSEEFNWGQYLSLTGAEAAPRSAFAARSHVVAHGFVVGMRLECTDLMDPRLVCVATVARVVADLLKVHFDGWGAEYDQWLWAHSTDMYPVGWCRAVRHRLEGPLQPPRAPRRPAPRPPRRRRKQPERARPPGSKLQGQPPNSAEDSSQNSDMGDAKSLSPPNSVPDMAADAEPPRAGDVIITPPRDVVISTPPRDDANPMPPREDANTMPPRDDANTTPPREDANSMPPRDDANSMPPRDDANTMPPRDDANTMPPRDDANKTLSIDDCNTSPPSDDVVLMPPEDDQSNMDVDIDMESNICDPPEEQQSESNHSNQELIDLVSPPTDTSQDSIQNIPQLSPEDPIEIADISKVIPRLVNTTIPFDILNSVDVKNWTTADVATFLTVNDCQPYCDNFSHITGPMMLQLSKDEIIELLEMKVGPSLKIFDLIQQLKCKIKQPQCRMLSFK